MKKYFLFFLLLLNLAFSSPAIGAQLPEGFAEVQIAGDLDPTRMVLAPDGRIFIAEKNGRVLIVRNDQLLPDPFIQIEVDNFNERGLSGIALHPDFEQNNLFYLFYTVTGGNFNRISRFTANGDYAIPDSEEVILEMDQLSGTIHNGGAMAFGPDGKLYIATGDGAEAENGQSLNNLLGKVLRINEDGSIPEDNPFYDQTQGRNRAIYALGFRNPFTMDLQPGTGRIFANDVGSNLWEEVNDVVKGGNYGWAGIEGMISFQIPPENYQDPVYAYDHDTGCAVMGAAFYSPDTLLFPERYHGKYFFGDYCQGYIKVLDPDSGEIIETFATNVDRPVSILFTPNGDMYYIQRAGIGGGSMQDNTSTTNGSLWRVFYTGDGAPIVSLQPNSVTVPIGEDATFSVSASGSQPLSYQWEKDGIAIPGANATTYIFENAQLIDDGNLFRCRITNAEGEIISQDAVLNVTTNTRPLPLILEPEDGLTYEAGDTIFFSGSANDAEDGALFSNALTWQVDFHHDEHTHPAIDNLNGVNEGFFVVPRVGETDDNVWFRIYLIATDSEGLTRRIYREVYPEKTTFTVLSEPPGLTVNVDGRSLTMPYTETSVVGIRRTLEAPIAQIRPDVLYSFDNWSNGWSQTIFPFFAGDIDTITVRYEADVLAIGEGTGLLGDYYPGFREEAYFARPVLSRIDPLIDFDWVFDSPDPAIEPDFFSVRWSGEVLAPLSADYTFHLVTDDGVRLWVDDQLIIDQWQPQPATETQGHISLEGGKRYKIKIEYFEEGGHSVAQMYWSSDKFAREIIPTSQFYPNEIIGITDDFRLNIYPSPAREMAQLEVRSWIFDQITWRMYDLSGRLLSKGEESIEVGVMRIALPTANLSPGLYVVKVDGRNAINGLLKFIKR